MTYHYLVEFSAVRKWNDYIDDNQEYYREYNMVDLQTYYIAYLITVPSLAFLLCGLKGRYFATFYTRNSRLTKRS